MSRKTVAEINLNNLIKNYEHIKKISHNNKIIAVVKADAYGHGAVKVAEKLVRENVDVLGVAYVSEGVELRDAGITSPILVFFDNENIEEYFSYNLIPVLFDEYSIQKFSEGAKKFETTIDVHVKVDTGMGRVGLLPENCLSTLYSLRDSKEIKIKGIMSHFSEADLSDMSFAMHQLEIFTGIVNELRKEGFRLLAHIANSAGVITFPDSHLDAVRPGLMIYGYSPVGKEGGLSPLMKVKTSLLSLRKVPTGTPVSYGRTFVTDRPSRIGVIPVGYADGYSRVFSNKGFVMVRGKKAPVIGRVCMDITMIDLTDIEDVEEEDEVVILSDDINSGLTAQDVSSIGGTIPYEILTSFGNNAKKMYRE